MILLAKVLSIVFITLMLLLVGSQKSDAVFLTAVMIKESSF